MHYEKWVFVTSGDSGIGSSIVKKLTAEGYKVIFTYRSKRELALRIANDIKQQGGHCLCFYCDVRDYENLDKLCTRLISDHGAPYGIINNTGIKNDKLLINTDIQDWQDVINTNLNGPFYVIRSLLPSMVTAGDGCIINISSVSALRGNPGQTSYSASKAALTGLTQSLTREVGIFNIRVNNIVPGLIGTDMISSLDAKKMKQLLSLTSLRKPGNTDDIAHTVSYLLGDGAKYITGQNIIVDGGLSI